MIIGLTRAGLGNVGSLADLIRHAAANGFGAVDASGGQIRELLIQLGESGVREMLEEHNMRIGAINLPVQWRGDDAVFREGLGKLVQDAEAAAHAGCTVSTTFIPPSTDRNAAAFMAHATRRLRLCAELLDAYGIKLALEFVGPHHMRMKERHPFIWTAEDTLTMIEAIGRRNVGLLYDSYHWYTNGLTAGDIVKLDRSQIVHVHISDAPDVPVAEALDNDRLYPGEGVIDLAAFLRALAQIGYQGVVSQEVLLKQPPQESGEALIRKSAQALRKLLAAADLQACGANCDLDRPKPAFARTSRVAGRRPVES